MTEEQRAKLQTLVRDMRNIAAKVGSMHGWWDGISDIEAFLAGKPTIVTMTPDEWIAYAEKNLAKVPK